MRHLCEISKISKSLLGVRGMFSARFSVGDSVKLRCYFCKIVFDCPDFVAVAQVQSEDCYITRVGIKHKLSEVPRDG